MTTEKIVYLDEYRKARQYRSLLEMIEGHLAEAGLLERRSSACGISYNDSEEKSQLLNADGGSMEALSLKCSAAKEFPDT